MEDPDGDAELGVVEPVRLQAGRRGRTEGRSSTPSKAAPAHSASASSDRCRGPEGRPAPSATAASPARASNRASSASPASRSSVYPLGPPRMGSLPDTVTNRSRSRATVTRRAESLTRCPAHSSSASRSRRDRPAPVDGQHRQQAELSDAPQVTGPVGTDHRGPPQHPDLHLGSLGGLQQGGVTHLCTPPFTPSSPPAEEQR